MKPLSELYPLSEFDKITSVNGLNISFWKTPADLSTLLLTTTTCAEQIRSNQNLMAWRLGPEQIAIFNIETSLELFDYFENILEHMGPQHEVFYFRNKSNLVFKRTPNVDLQSQTMTIQVRSGNLYPHKNSNPKIYTDYKEIEEICNWYATDEAKVLLVTINV